jgi:hypothetical protein
MFQKKSASVFFYRIYVNLTLSAFLRPHLEILKSSQVIILSSQHLTILQITVQKYAPYTAIYLPINFNNLLLGVFFCSFLISLTSYRIRFVNSHFSISKGCCAFVDPSLILRSAFALPSFCLRSAFVLPPLYARFLGTDLERFHNGLITNLHRNENISSLSYKRIINTSSESQLMFYHLQKRIVLFRFKLISIT